MAKRTTYLTSLAILAMGALAAPSAQAAYVVTFEEVGANVLETGGGSLDVADLSFVTTLTSASAVEAKFAFFASGAAGAFQDTYFAAGDLGPSSFGPGSIAVANLTGGDSVSLIRSDHRLSVPEGYTGGPLSETSTYLDASLASLGLTPGTYVYSWGTGDHADTFTIDVVASTVPEPSTWAMMLLGFAGLSYAAARRGARVRA